MRSNAFAISCLCLALGFHAAVFAAAPRLKSVAIERPVIELFESCELTIHIEGSVNNPYDPEELAIEATFRPPQGPPITVWGFYYEGFKLATDQGREVIRPFGKPVWKVRFTPRQTGFWSYSVTLKTKGATQTLPGQEFEVVQSARRGFLRINRASGYLQFDRGETFIPIGENLCWPPRAQPLKAYEQWFQELARQRANFIRVWLAPWSLRLETSQTGVGRYDQLRAWQLDYLLNRSESFGLYWQLCLLDHGSFSRSQDPEWHNNPYNEQLGGMCRLPSEFLTNPRAKMFFQRLLRYLVSRWGYSTSLSIWELFNEADLSEINLEDLAPWVAQMGGFLRSSDPNLRPVTISFHKASAEAIWKSPAIDLAQIHVYEERDFAEGFCGSRISQLASALRKPVMVGEFGWITQFVRQLDEGGIHLHDALWSSLIGGSIGGALIWYWDEYVHPNNLERHFWPLAQFWRGEQLKERTGRLELAFSDADLEGCGFGTRDRAYLWIKNRTHNIDQYLAYRCEIAKQRLRQQRNQEAKPVNYPPRVVRGATATVRGLDAAGRYRIEWWDPYRGQIVASSISHVREGTLTAQVPDLMFDVAVKLIKLPWWKEGSS